MELIYRTLSEILLLFRKSSLCVIKTLRTQCNRGNFTATIAKKNYSYHILLSHKTNFTLRKPKTGTDTDLEIDVQYCPLLKGTHSILPSIIANIYTDRLFMYTCRIDSISHSFRVKVKKRSSYGLISC